MAGSVGGADMVSRQSAPSRSRPSKTSSSGIYVSVMASYSQSSSRKSSYLGWRTKGRCACRTRLSYPSGRVNESPCVGRIGLLRREYKLGNLESTLHRVWQDIREAP